MTSFLLPCECAQSIVISAGQAGGVVECPACGRKVAVPKLRDVGRLEPVSSGQPHSTSGWRLAHACMLVGGITALLAWCGAAVFGVAPQASVTSDTIRANVAAASDKQILEAWKALSQSGVARPPLPDEKRLQQRFHFRSGVSRVLLAVGALGAVVGLAGAGMWATARTENR